MTDDSFMNNDYSHINTKYNAKRIEQCYEIYWYSVNMFTKKKKKKNRVYISCITYPSNTKGESEYVNTYCLITLLLFILDVINKTLVLVQLHNMYEHI